MSIYRQNEINWIKSAFSEFFHPITVLVSTIKKVANVSKKTEDLEFRLKLLHDQLNQTTLEYDSFYKEIKIFFEKQNLSTKENMKYIVNLDSGIKDTNLMMRKYLGHFTENKKNVNFSYIDEMTFKISELKTKELVNGDKLTLPAAEMGMANIQYLLSIIQQNESKKPYLIGVNRGGTSLACFLAKRLDLEAKYVLRCDYNKDYGRVIDQDKKRTELDGPIVIIDDITRTGTTLRNVQKYIKDKYRGSKILTFILLVSCKNEKNFSELNTIIDYTPWFTQNDNVHLPWNDVKEDENIIPGEFFNDLEINQFLGRLSYDFDENKFSDALEKK